ncbi:MAG: putative addiction module antidote protein [Treponema sp.]|nr:putative addiction module antidote protein [Treponema sp.]
MVWDIFEELKTKEDIDGFVEASIEAAQDDTDPSLLAHALGVAAKARGMLETANEIGLDRAGLYRSFVKGGDPRISTFDKVARSLGYQLSLIPVKTEIAI